MRGGGGSLRGGGKPMKRRRDGSLKVYLALSKSVYLNYFAYLKECGKEPDEMFPEVVSYIPGIWRG